MNIEKREQGDGLNEVIASFARMPEENRDELRPVLEDLARDKAKKDLLLAKLHTKSLDWKFFHHLNILQMQKVAELMREFLASTEPVDTEAKAQAIMHALES